MNPKVITVGPKTPLREVLQLMLRYRLNGILVVDSEQKLEGVVTYSDLSRKLLPTQKELMEHEEYLTTPQLMEDRFRDIVNVPVDAIAVQCVLATSQINVSVLPAVNEVTDPPTPIVVVVGLTVMDCPAPWVIAHDVDPARTSPICVPTAAVAGKLNDNAAPDVAK